MSIANSLIKSYANVFSLEVTTVLGCPVDCIYCPQKQLRKEAKDRSKILKYNDFKNAVDNIDIESKIHWTGYSEPCLSRELDEMVLYASSKHIPQYISTTLTGSKKSIDFLIESRNFYSFQLHLPDNSGLMRGIKVDSNYVDTVERCLTRKYEQGLASTVHIACIGNDLHPAIKEVVIDKKKLWGSNSNQFVVGIDQVYSRASGLEKEQLKGIGLKLGDFTSQKKKKNFFCEQKNINSPVLLPDGSLSICSFDYGLRMTYGNLFKERLSEIRKEWILRIASDFNKGTLSPCIDCEFYWTF